MISIPVLYFFIALGIFLAALLATAGFYYFRLRRRQKYPYGKWENLLKRLSSVDRGNVALIALDFIDESGNRRVGKQDSDIDPSQIWPLIGGMAGLEAMERDCDVLVDLVFYVQQWYPGALPIAEQLRLSGREIAWHVSRLKAAEQTGKLEALFPDYAQRAVARYYLMTRRVLDLYDRGNVPGLFELQRALG
jgi:hypothetical protein